MEIKNVINLMKFMTQVSENNELINNYQQLLVLIKKHQETADAIVWHEIMQLNEKVIQQLKQTQPLTENKDIEKIFDKLNKDQLFGNVAADYFTRAFQIYDTKDIAADIDRRIKQTTEFNALIKQIIDLLAIMFFDEFEMEDSSNSSMLYIYFEGDVAIKSMADLEKYIRIWDGIIKSFNELCGYEFGEVEVYKVNNHHVSVKLTSYDTSIKALMRGTISMVEILNKTLKIRSLQNEIKQFHHYETLNEILENELQQATVNNAATVAESLIDQYYHGTLANSNLYENLHRSLKLLLNFIEKGGKIRGTIANQPEQEIAWNKKLQEAYQMVAQLKNQE